MSGDIELDSAAQSDSLRTRGFDMSRYLFATRLWPGTGADLAVGTGGMLALDLIPIGPA